MIGLNYIGGEWVAGAAGERIAVEDPATGETFADAARAMPEDVDRAVAAARRCVAERTWMDARSLQEYDQSVLRGRSLMDATESVDHRARQVPPGLDLFETRESTYQDFGQSPIPGIFFSFWSFPFRFRGRVSFRGRPIAREVLGSTDTVVVRREPAELPGPSTVPIELVALNLESIEPIEIRTLWGRREQWDVRVATSAVRPSEGRMTITQGDGDGGRFESDLTVHPRFTFVRRRDGRVRTIDGRGSLDFRADDAKWSSDAAATDPPVRSPA